MTQQESPGPARMAMVAALVVGTAVAACDADPFEPQWPSAIDTVQLFTLARPELNLPSAFGFNSRRTFRVEGATSSGSWDLALDTQGGELVFLPPGALDIPSGAGISLRPDATFDELQEAPRDTAEYALVEPVPVEVGAVYAIRTAQETNSFGTRCVYFAKMEPVEMDPEGGTVRFRFEANPICNDSRLVPTEGAND